MLPICSPILKEPSGMVGWLTLIAALSLSPVDRHGTVELRAPTTIVLSLFNVHRSLALLSRCAGPDLTEELDDRYGRLEVRFTSALIEAEGAWPELDGSHIATLADEFAPDLPACDSSQIDAAAQGVEAALSNYASYFAELTSDMRKKTAWLGPLQLCLGTVESVTETSNWMEGSPALAIKLRPPAALALYRATKVLTNDGWSQMPLRLDGKVIARLGVVEPVDSGVFQVAPPEEDQWAQIRQRTSAPCS
jgi:hypothetical protein